MRKNLLAVAVSLFLTCILSLATMAMAVAFYREMIAAMEELQVPPGHIAWESDAHE